MKAAEHYDFVSIEVVFVLVNANLQENWVEQRFSGKKAEVEWKCRTMSVNDDADECYDARARVCKTLRLSETSCIYCSDINQNILFSAWTHSLNAFRHLKHAHRAPLFNSNSLFNTAQHLLLQFPFAVATQLQKTNFHSILNSRKKLKKQKNETINLTAI